MQSQTQIVALFFRRVGDSLLATPALRAIKQHYPEWSLNVIAEKGTVRVFQHNPWIDRIIEFPAIGSSHSLSAAIQSAGSVHTAVDFLSDPRTAIACFLSHAPNRIGFEKFGRSWLYTITVARQNSSRPIYSASHKLTLLRSLDIYSDDIVTDFYLSDSERRDAESLLRMRNLLDKKIVAINVYSRRNYKQWPLDKFSEFTYKISAHPNAFPLLLCGPGEQDHVMHFAQLANLNENNILMAENLGNLAAVLKLCSIYVGNDGGAKHLAVAVGTPTVTVFRRDPPKYWTPPDSTRHVALDDRSGKCVSANDVFEAVRRFL